MFFFILCEIIIIIYSKYFALYSHNNLNAHQPNDLSTSTINDAHRMRESVKQGLCLNSNPHKRQNEISLRIIYSTLESSTHTQINSLPAPPPPNNLDRDSPPSQKHVEISNFSNFIYHQKNRTFDKQRAQIELLRRARENVVFP